MELANPAMKIETALGTVRLDAAALSSDCTSLQAARRLWLRRLSFWAPIGVATILGTALGGIATAGVASPLRLPLLGLLALNLAYMGLVGTPAVIGFCLHLARRKFRAGAQPSGLSRTAMLMPVHCEDPRTVFAAIEVMARGLSDAELGTVDIFVLSDTQDVAHANEELAAFEALQARSSLTPRLHYRRRAGNAGRKVGNLAEFCASRGGEYDYMLVLDADSLMGASAIARLIGLMDANPRAGIIQTVPYAVGRDTLFGRLQQFSARLYTPLLVEGLTFWQQSDGNYWGHNAIIRIAPFMAHCGLPVLPGREPWGGEILCHDVVEAGLMRGAGWDVWVLPEVLESFEAVPANMVDFAVRERRWCQGNLQHSGVIGLPGFRPVGRFHLGYGIAHYLAAPAAVAFLALATADAMLGGGFARALLSGSGAAAGLVALGAVLLYAGKFASLVAALADGAEARGYGGRLPLLASAVVEQLASCILSALLIVIYARYVVDLLRGRTVRWDAQPRDDRGLSWTEGWMRMRFPTMVGLSWLACLPFLPQGLSAWTLPLLLGLLAAWPMTVLSSRVGIGRWARSVRLLLTPEETHTPAIVRAYHRALLTPAVPDHHAPAPALLQLASGEAV
jgi:membrane glycosyltransferase